MIEALRPARDDFSSAWTLGDKMSDGAFGSVYRADPVGSAEESPAPYAVKRFPKEDVDDLFAQQVIKEV